MLFRSLIRANPLITAPRRFFNLHEYQSMHHLNAYGIPTPKGFVASTPDEAKAIADMFPDEELVVKSQVLAGGRGKGRFYPNGFRGGVHIVNRKEIREIVKKMVGQRLITKQTGQTGKPCDMVMIQQKLDLKRELYFAILLDRKHGLPTIVASTDGGMDIEEVAKRNPDAVHAFPIQLQDGITREFSKKVADQLEFVGDMYEPFHQILTNLYRCFSERDLVQLEINPLGITVDNRILVCDAKLNFDDNASYRQKDIFADRDLRQENKQELEAQRYGMSYIGLDGNIGCLVNGAGLAMATLDLIKLMGGEPANFLDVGGGATEDQIMQALRVLQNSDAVDAILINIFGGILRCDVIASGIVNAVSKINLRKPLVARLVGTNFDQAQQIIKNSGVRVVSISDEEEAVTKIVGISEIIRLAREIKVHVDFKDLQQLSSFLIVEIIKLHASNLKFNGLL